MRYSFRTDQFCALSTDQTFHKWLEDVDKEVYAGLQVHLKRNPGCRANKEYMKMVRRQLSANDLNDELIKFLRDYFPTVLKPIIEPRENNKIDLSELNKHGVFRIYRPHILTFPHKYIIVDSDLEQLKKKIVEFIKDKIGTDYIIIEDRVYIEYFEPRFKEEAETVPREVREIWLYKKRKKK
jgi:hypothetical protein